MLWFSQQNLSPFLTVLSDICRNVRFRQAEKNYRFDLLKLDFFFFPE